MKKIQNDYKVEIDHRIGTVDIVSDAEGIQYGTVAINEFFNKGKIEANNKIIPFHAICHVESTVQSETVDVDDDTCISDAPTPGKPYFVGVDNKRIRQGIGIDLYEGVHAYDAYGNEIPFTVGPDEIDKCELGSHEVVYSAEGITVTRIITIVEIPNPTIYGLTEITVMAGEEFDPLDGVTAKDGNGNDAEVRIVA